MKSRYRYIYMVLILPLLMACGAQDDVVTTSDRDNMIHVGEVSTIDMLTTASVTRAESTMPQWLQEGLAGGMNVLYFKGEKKQLAILKYDNGSYSFMTDEETPKPCEWLDNGNHVFEGVYAPAGLFNSESAKNYVDLTHYTAIPPSKKIAATIDRITIPLQHRLARVVAYVLIDNSMKNYNGDKTKLMGYDKDNYNAENTKLRFGNVYVLDYVDSQGHPIWKKEKKAIPNYIGEETIKVYKDKSGKLIFPIDTEWETANSDNNNNYTFTEYVSAPYYDIIVRPTYTDTEDDSNVMYDELDLNKTDDNKNQIDFELTLDNDLEYEKHFTFDLNANDETVVYLRVNPERIDYNNTGSRLWKTESYGDSYYGVNNKNGNKLSMAGSSWQRAYTNSSLDTGVTDGHKYNADDEDVAAQYVGDEKWIDLLSTAVEGGDCDGKYFILQKDITIDVTKFPEDFVFKGHLDALDHTITLTGVDENHNWLFGGMGIGWNAEILNAKIIDGVLFDPNSTISGYVNNCWNGDKHIDDVTPTIPDYK